MTQSKGYIVKRPVRDGHAGGNDGMAYIKIEPPETPNSGELVYHGEFTSRSVEIEDRGPMGSVYATHYFPVDQSKLTSEPFNGSVTAHDANVETF
ncbi:hypothetical protein KBI23_05565 [bacterium]|nr:hypothetical protein [bacterium]MBP9810595.1 hypothetical protein [bacterium]